MTQHQTARGSVTEEPTSRHMYEVPVTADKVGRIVEVDRFLHRATLGIGPPARQCDPWTFLTAGEARSVADALNRVADLIDKDEEAIDLLATTHADGIKPSDMDQCGRRLRIAALGQLFDPSRKGDHDEFRERIQARVTELQAEQAA